MWCADVLENVWKIEFRRITAVAGERLTASRPIPVGSLLRVKYLAKCHLRTIEFYSTEEVQRFIVVKTKAINGLQPLPKTAI